MTFWVVIGILIKICIVVGITQGAVAYLILRRAEGRGLRAGPDRAEPRGASSASRSACSSRWPTAPRCCSRKT